jgi:hypothetical protein
LHAGRQAKRTPRQQARHSDVAASSATDHSADMRRMETSAPARTSQTAAPPFAGATGEPYITRLHPRANCGPGWMVQIPLPESMSAPGRVRTVRRSFCSGTLEESLARAVAWRDLWHQRLYGAPVPVRSFHRQQSNGQTGVPGVRRIVKRNRKGDRVQEIEVYIAEVWNIPGRNGERPRQTRSRLFSIHKYGEDEAFRLACEWRREAQARLARGESIPSARSTPGP